MSKFTKKLRRQIPDLAEAWNRGLKNFIRKGKGTAKDFIKKFGHGHTLTPKHRTKELLGLAFGRTAPASSPMPPLAAHPMPVPAAPKVVAPAPPSIESPDDGDGMPRSAKAQKEFLRARKRCAVIVRWGMRNDCVRLACGLAFHTDMSASEAIRIMQSTLAAQAARDS